MPPKVRQLRRELQQAGFREISRRGKGSHTWWQHPGLPEFPINLAGQDGDDAKPYQVKDVRDALAALERKQKGGKSNEGTC